MLDNPDSDTLMMVMAGMGLLQNFAALRSLVTTGIQQGHMKMHLNNILMQLNADAIQRDSATKYFADKTVSMSGVKNYLESLSKL
jgi:hydroxymethylglutaryl-CoA reductase